jgi:hypothetical protein
MLPARRCPTSDHLLIPAGSYPPEQAGSPFFFQTRRASLSSVQKPIKPSRCALLVPDCHLSHHLLVQPLPEPTHRGPSIIPTIDTTAEAVT